MPYLKLVLELLRANVHDHEQQLHREVSYVLSHGPELDQK